MAGTRRTAEGQDETVSATSITAEIPHPIAVSGRVSSPNGIDSKARMAQGMIHSPVIGTASRLPTRPYTAIRLK